MAYGSHGFLPFLFESFPRKNCCLIVVDLLLFGWLCCWLNCLLNLFFAHKEEKVIFRTIAFDSLSQHNRNFIFFTIPISIAGCSYMENYIKITLLIIGLLRNQLMFKSFIFLNICI